MNIADIKRSKKMIPLNIEKSLSDQIVPKSQEPYYRSNRLPPDQIGNDMVFCCRKFYSNKKRILKNKLNK